MTEQGLAGLLARVHSCRVLLGGEEHTLRLLSAREVLAMQRELCMQELPQGETRALYGNALLLKSALCRDGEPVFGSADEVLETLGTREINALIERYAALDAAANPSAEDGRERVEALKKA